MTEEEIPTERLGKLLAAAVLISVTCSLFAVGLSSGFLFPDVIQENEINLQISTSQHVIDADLAKDTTYNLVLIIDATALSLVQENLIVGDITVVTSNGDVWQHEIKTGLNTGTADDDRPDQSSQRTTTVIRRIRASHETRLDVNATISCTTSQTLQIDAVKLALTEARNDLACVLVFVSAFVGLVVGLAVGCSSWRPSRSTVAVVATVFVLTLTLAAVMVLVDPSF